MHYYQFNIGDYKSHTEHLDLLEDLAFRRMIDWCYLHESPLPLDINLIAKKILMRTHTESIANVLEEFFVKTENGYINKRVMIELDAFKAKSDSARRAAEARWAKVKAQSEGNADALQAQSEGNAKQETPNNNHNPLNINQEKDFPSPPKAAKFSQDDFDCAEWFYSLLLKLNPAHKKPNLNAWADDIRKIVNIDNRSYNEISDLMLWVNQDSFWSTNILSPKKLREKWDQLIIQRTRKPANKTEARTINNLSVGEDFLNEH